MAVGNLSLGRNMKTILKAYLCEIVAAGLLAGGAFLLVATYLPVINPDLFRYATDEFARVVRIDPSEMGERVQSLGRYLIGTVSSVLLLALAWHFNLKAFRSRGQIG